MRRLTRFFALMLALVLTLSASPLIAAESIPEPTLSPDANPYDAEHPELLDEDQLYAASAILIEASSGNVIFEKNADAVMYPASTTKIMTVMLGIMCGDLEETVTASSTAVDIPDDASNMDLREGEEINFLDLLYGTMLRSANEGANLIAETVSGSISAFVDLMNEYAQLIGCTSTHFANPDGYHDDNHYSTARDLAMITREAMKDETFRKIVSTVTYTLPRSNKQRSRTLSTTARILIPSTESNENKYYYPDAIGVKTGSTSRAGYCFVGAAERDGVELISVVLFTGNRARWADTIKMMDYGFSQYVSVTPADLYNMNPITIDTTNYSLEDADMGRLPLTCVPAVAGVNASITATRDEVDAMAKNLREVVLIEYKRDFVAPIQAGEVVGTMTYFPEKSDPVEYNLIASRTVAKRENAPKTLEEIVAETEADPNPFPPFTLEMALYLLLPVAAVVLLVKLLRRARRRRRSRLSKVPKPKNRYMK